MKKFMIVPLLALIAGVAFAGTDPVFSGTFSTYVGFSFDEAGKGQELGSRIKDSLTNEIKLDLKATIDDWNTVSAVVEMSDALLWDDKNDDKTIDSAGNAIITTTGTTTDTVGDTLVAGNELSNEGRYLRLSQFTLTSDILGALGVTGPFGMSIKFGKFAFAPSSVASVSPKSTDSANGHDGTTDGHVGMQFDFKILDMITVSTVVFPANIEDLTYNPNQRFEGGVMVKGMGIADMIDFSAYFISSKYDYRNDEDVDDTFIDDKGMVAGASVALSVSMFKFGLAWENDFDAKYAKGQSDNGMAKSKQEHKLQFDMLTTLMDGALKFGFSVGMESFSEIVSNMKFKLGMEWQIVENFGIFLAGGLGSLDTGPFVARKNLAVDLGMTVNLKALAIQLGWSHNLDFKAPEDDFKNVVYVKFSSTF